MLFLFKIVTLIIAVICFGSQGDVRMSVVSLIFSFPLRWQTTNWCHSPLLSREPLIITEVCSSPLQFLCWLRNRSPRLKVMTSVLGYVNTLNRDASPPRTATWLDPQTRCPEGRQYWVYWIAMSRFGILCSPSVRTTRAAVFRCKMESICLLV